MKDFMGNHGIIKFFETFKRKMEAGIQVCLRKWFCEFWKNLRNVGCDIDF